MEMHVWYGWRAFDVFPHYFPFKFAVADCRSDKKMTSSEMEIFGMGGIILCILKLKAGNVSSKMLVVGSLFFCWGYDWTGNRHQTKNTQNINKDPEPTCVRHTHRCWRFAGDHSCQSQSFLLPTPSPLQSSADISKAWHLIGVLQQLLKVSLY